VDVAQELIVRIEDCGTTRGVRVGDIRPDDEKIRAYLETRIDGRVLARDVELSDGAVLPAGTMISPQIMV
jgi:DNA-directed RNA polymerase subunit beta'